MKHEKSEIRSAFGGPKSGIILCAHCKTDPGIDPRSPHLWNGFLDKDTGEYVCWHCRPVHYIKKSDTQFADYYSEFPVPVKTK